MPFHLHCLVKVHSHHLLHAVFDHLGGEEVGFPFLVHGDFPVVLQQDGADGLGGVGHVNGAIVPNHLTEIGQGPTVVQVEVAAKKTPQWLHRIQLGWLPDLFQLCRTWKNHPKYEGCTWRVFGMLGRAQKAFPFLTRAGRRKARASPDDDTVQEIRQPPVLGDVGKVREAPLQPWENRQSIRNASLIPQNHGVKGLEHWERADPSPGNTSSFCVQGEAQRRAQTEN